MIINNYHTIGRIYKRITQRGAYGEEFLSKALSSLSEGMPLKTAARDHGIPAKTLRRHRDGNVRTPGSVHLGRFAVACRGSWMPGASEVLGCPLRPFLSQLP